MKHPLKTRLELLSRYLKLSEAIKIGKGGSVSENYFFLYRSKQYSDLKLHLYLAFFLNSLQVRREKAVFKKKTIRILTRKRKEIPKEKLATVEEKLRKQERLTTAELASV